MPTQRKHRQQSSSAVEEVEVPTTERYIWEVIERVPHCVNCDALYMPCFEAEGLTSSKRQIIGICNDRAVRAGYAHAISPQALAQRTFTNRR